MKGECANADEEDGKCREDETVMHLLRGKSTYRRDVSRSLRFQVSRFLGWANQEGSSMLDDVGMVIISGSDILSAEAFAKALSSSWWHLRETCWG